jgi:hypothetical protein
VKHHVIILDWIIGVFFRAGKPCRMHGDANFGAIWTNDEGCGHLLGFLEPQIGKPAVIEHDGGLDVLVAASLF